MSDYQVFFDEGRAFHKAARGSIRRPEVFTPEIVQNIAAMAIEKYFMAIFLKRGRLPLNHTASDFLMEAKLFLPVSEELENTLLYMDQLQQLCSMETFKITPPDKNDVFRFLKAADETAAMAEREIFTCDG
ncbi:MAG: hypothetical protein LBT05_03560 [Planctomycetaceae bacterium]|jgi:hypothetical protein|nr:hypothetical protein [Planctomycetaceae bacterium]